MKRHRRILNAFKLKKPISKKYTLYDFKYTTVWKRQNYGNSKKISDFQHLEQKEGWIGRAQRTFKAGKLFRMIL